MRIFNLFPNPVQFKRLVTIVIFSMASSSYAQSIQEIFRKLPSEYAFGLPGSARDSLLRYESYVVPGSDSLETTKITINEESEDFMKLNYFFTTGQRAFVRIELRKFQKENGEPLVVYAKYGGAPAVFDQHKLQAFDYDKKKLTPNYGVGLPEVIPAETFLKCDWTGKIKKEEVLMNTSYDLKPEEAKSVAYLVHPYSAEEEALIKTNAIVFTWNGKRFEKKEVN